MADPTPPRLIPQLPDDLSLRCIARVPRSSHPDLALVSPSWRSLLRSPLLFKLRSDLGVTEPSLCIHICHSVEEARWYLLIRGHHRRPGRLLPLPLAPLPRRVSASAVLGHSLFVLGLSKIGISASTVQIFNPHTNCWLRGPKMGTARNSGATASTLGGLAVGYNAGVGFDTIPWTAVSESLFNGWGSLKAEVNGVIYSYLYTLKLSGYDPVTDDWKPVEGIEGIEGELPNQWYDVKLANLGGLLCLVWLGSWRNSKETELNCVGIEITRTSCRGLRGSVAWRESASIAISGGPSSGPPLGPCMALEF